MIAVDLPGFGESPPLPGRVDADAAPRSPPAVAALLDGDRRARLRRRGQLARRLGRARARRSTGHARSVGRRSRPPGCGARPLAPKPLARARRSRGSRSRARRAAARSDRGCAACALSAFAGAPRARAARRGGRGSCARTPRRPASRRSTRRCAPAASRRSTRIAVPLTLGVAGARPAGRPPARACRRASATSCCTTAATCRCGTTPARSPRCSPARGGVEAGWPDSADVTLRVNGEEHALRVDTAHHAARRAARAPRADRRQEGLRPRPVRRLHRAARRPAGERLPGAGGRARRSESPPSRASPTATSCTRCRRRSSSTTRSSAATARPARSARPSACSPRRRPGWPSAVTADLARPRPRAARRRGDPRAHERQPVPLRRLREHRRRRSLEAAPMRPFALRARPTTRRRPSATVAGERRAPRTSAGGTNLVDLMRLGVATPDAARRRPPAAARRRIEPSCRRRPADRRRRPQQRPGRRSRRAASATRCSRRRCWPARRASCATWPRSAATCCSAPAAPYFQDVTKPCNKRRPGLGLPGARGRPPQPGDPRRTRRPASPPTRPTWRSRWRRSTRVVHVRGARRASARCRLAGAAPAAGRRARARHRARARRPDHRGRAAAARRLAARSALPQGARPGVVRVRRGVGGRGARRRHDGVVRDVRIALGGVAPRAVAGRAGRGRRCAAAPATEEAFRAAADAELAAAEPLRDNALQGAAGRATCSSGRSSSWPSRDGGAADDDDRLAAPRRRRVRSTRVEGAREGHRPRPLRLRAPRRRRRLRRAGAGDRRPRRDPRRSTPPRRSRMPGVLASCRTRTRPAWRPSTTPSSAVLQSRARRLPRARSSPPWSPRRSEAAREARGLVRVDYDARAARRACCAPTTRSSTRPTRSTRLPDRHRAGRPRRRARGRGRPRRRDLHDPGRCTTTRWSRTPRSPPGTATAHAATTPTRARSAARARSPRCSACRPSRCA